jgi:hypothetical protein
MLTRRIRQESPLFIEGDKCGGAWLVMRHPSEKQVRQERNPPMGQVALSMQSGPQQVAINYAKAGVIRGLAEALGNEKYRSNRLQQPT